MKALQEELTAAKKRKEELEITVWKIVHSADKIAKETQKKHI